MVAKSYSKGFYFPVGTDVLAEFNRKWEDNQTASNVQMGIWVGVWTRMEDEMPEPNVTFLGHIRITNVIVSFMLVDRPDCGYNGINHEFCNLFNGVKNRGVTHWMKMPEPPID